MVFRPLFQLPIKAFYVGFVTGLFGIVGAAPGAHAQALPIFRADSVASSSTSPAAISSRSTLSDSTSSTRVGVPAPHAHLVSVSNEFSTNATTDERTLVIAQVGSIANLLAKRNEKALEIFALDIAPATSQLRVSAVISRLATSMRGALVRVHLSFVPVVKSSLPSNKITAGNKPTSTPAKTDTSRSGFSYDIWFARVADSSFALVNAWLLPADAATQLQSDSLRLWNETLAAQKALTAPAASSVATHNGTRSTAVSALMVPNIALNRGGDILTLVAEYRGGRWVALRANAPWQGAVLDSANLARATARMQIAARTVLQEEQAASSSKTTAVNTAVPDSFSRSKPPTFTGDVDLDKANSNQWIRPWLVSQMNRYRRRAAGTAHFVLQRSGRGWVGIDSVFEPAREASDPSYARADESARALRASLDNEFLSPQAHYNYAVALSRVSLFNEAADEIEKAAAMQPELVTEAQKREFETARRDDVQSRVDAQRNIAKRIGYSADHPLKRLPLYQNNFRARPTPLLALRLALEYSRLAYEREAITWYDYAMKGASSFVTTANPSDRAWVNVLRDQTKIRFDLAATKPGNIIRSDLFTVRCTLNDVSIVQLLAGLEASQYTIYSRFGVPMGNTEVILWSSQALFQNYTTRQAGRNTSEFVTALTLTQLVNADVGPVVLSEEINFFADPRADSISTIAHEYGHIAVRNIARGREVPDWFNEGIATYVEGGYENYLSRVRNARQRGTLLSMRELRAWRVDGERAFLAYSQANSLIDFIVGQKNWGGQAILDILTKIGQDVPPDDAIKSILRVTPDQLYILWTRHLTEQDAARKKAAASSTR